MQSRRKVFVVGVGMTKFEKPGSRPNFDYPDMVREAVTAALNDAKLKYDNIQQAAIGYMYGETCSGQRALYEVGMTGIPIYNVNNACATGSTALYMCKQFIEAGNAECALAVGFEKMQRGSLDSAIRFDDRANPVEKHVQVISDSWGLEASPMTAQMFGNAGREHMKKYGTKPEHFAKIAWKNHKHSVNNPKSQFQTEYSLDEISKSRMVHEPLTKLQCCPTSDGAAAAILCSESFIEKHPALKATAVEIVGMVLATDFPSSFNENSCLKMIGYDVTKAAAKRLFSESGLRPDQVNVIELHDCFSANELITYEALGLCPEGKAGDLIDKGDNTYGGKWVINPSGGLISKGHPIGATGVAQCAELCWQLRGLADKRQVSGAKLALQHNIGIGGACMVALYRKAFPNGSPAALSGAGGAKPSGAKISSDFKSDQVFQFMIERAAAEPKRLANVIGTVFQFKITNGGASKKETKDWNIDCRTEPIQILPKPASTKADCEFTVADNDLFTIAEGKLAIESAFMQGKLKIKGSMAKAMKLRDLLNVQEFKSKL